MLRRFYSQATSAGRSVGEGFTSRRALDNLTSQELMKKDFRSEGRSAYAGFDPTSNKLHLGNLMQVVSLCRTSLYGFKPIFLIGGATGKIGDPSGKSSERSLLSDEALEANKQAMTSNLTGLVQTLVTYVNSRQAEYGLPRQLQVVSNYIVRSSS